MKYIKLTESKTLLKIQQFKKGHWIPLDNFSFVNSWKIFMIYIFLKNTLFYSEFKLVYL